MNMKKLDIRVLSYLFVIFFLLLLYRYFDYFIAIFRLLMDVTAPLFIGALIAYLLNIIVVRLERSVLKKLKEKQAGLTRGASILSSIIIVVAVLYLIINLIVPQIATIISRLVSGIPVLVTQIQNFIMESDTELLEKFVGDNLLADFNDLARQAIDFVSNSVNQLLASSIYLIGGATSGLFTFVIAFSFAMYVLATKERLKEQTRLLGVAFLPKRVYSHLSFLIQITNQTFSNFFVGQVTEAVILGSLCIIGMAIFRFPYAVTVGTFIGFTALVPMFGAWIGAAVGFVLIASQSFTQAWAFLIFIVILQQLENNLIYPKVVGTSIGIPGIWVLVAVTVGGGVGGIAGMLLGVPVLATVYQIITIITQKKLAEKETVSS
ncbi:AI-2E family transporter [Jeotgalibaca arthritidis]|uniref:AI-2E family transporter n=1 Tax=Jeotgalibaca arthritidis TaxID=1868794 RepID=A0A6G7K857_9LACT|nr:AI-2E family transporter [Jeotgalibaca arthritidis]QII81422.1 AI-2E family transporter [Jeotgalibaca arthritidis]